jgi:hypothetical protein
MRDRVIVGLVSVAVLVSVVSVVKLFEVSARLRAIQAPVDPVEIQRAMEEGVSRALAREKNRGIPAPIAD